MFIIDSILVVGSTLLIAQVNHKVSEHLKQIKH